MEDIEKRKVRAASAPPIGLRSEGGDAALLLPPPATPPPPHTLGRWRGTRWLGLGSAHRTALAADRWHGVQRMEAKAASEAKKKKDKEDLARQKLRKVEDKERRRTTKKEKRRG